MTLTPRKWDDVLAAYRAKMPPEQGKLLDEALAAGWRLEDDWRKIHARYMDYDLAEQVPRVLIYIDLGVLMGRIVALERALTEAGYALCDE